MLIKPHIPISKLQKELDEVRAISYRVFFLLDQ